MSNCVNRGQSVLILLGVLFFLPDQVSSGQVEYEVLNLRDYEPTIYQMWSTDWTVEGIGSINAAIAFANMNIVILVDRKTFKQHRINSSKMSDSMRAVATVLEKRFSVLSKPIDSSITRDGMEFSISHRPAEGLFPAGKRTKLVWNGETRFIQMTSRSGKVIQSFELLKGLNIRYLPNGKVFSLGYNWTERKSISSLLFNLGENGEVFCAGQARDEVPFGPLVNYYRNRKLEPYHDMKGILAHRRQVLFDPFPKPPTSNFETEQSSLKQATEDYYRRHSQN